MSTYPKVNIIEEDNLDKELLNLKRTDFRRPKGLIVRNYESLEGLGYYLSPEYDHKIVLDNVDALVLISVKKGII